MPQASTSRAQLFYVAETTWGTQPVGTPKLKELRFTGESLAHQKNTIQSAEIRQDGQVPDLIEVGASAGGNVNFELSYGAYDDWLSALFHSDWIDKVSLSASLTVTIPGGVGTIAGTSVGAGLVPGQYVRFVGFTNPLNNGFFTVATAAANLVTVVETTMAAEGPTAAVKVDASRLRNGQTEKSFSVEKLFSDITSGQYTKFHGMEPGSMSLNLQADAIVNGSWTFLGKEGLNGSTTFGDGAPTAATAFDVMNATSNVGLVKEGAPLLSYTGALQQVQFTVNDNLAGRRAIGSRGAIGIRQGRFVVTGNINAYFESGALYAKMIGHTASGLHLRVHDTPAAPTTGRSYLFTFPRIKFQAGDPVAPAVDQDVFLNMGFQAIRDPTLGITMQIDRFPAPA